MEFKHLNTLTNAELNPSQEGVSFSHVEQLQQKIGKENFPDNEEILLTKQAAKKVIENILLENNGKLPEFIVYPETSARVLPYLFNPSFRKIAEKTGTRPPMSYFMSIFGSHGDLEFFERDLLERERAQEILENAKLHGFDTGSVCIIDDTCIDGKSKSSAERAFNGRAIKMHYLLGVHSGWFGKVRDDVGHSFPDMERPRPGKPVAPFWRFSDEDKLKQVGVVKNKDEKYVSSYEESSFQDKKLLRDILSAIGEDISVAISDINKR